MMTRPKIFDRSSPSSIASRTCSRVFRTMAPGSRRRAAARMFRLCSELNDASISRSLSPIDRPGRRRSMRRRGPDPDANRRIRCRIALAARPLPSESGRGSATGREYARRPARTKPVRDPRSLTSLGRSSSPWPAQTCRPASLPPSPLSSISKRSPPDRLRRDVVDLVHGPTRRVPGPHPPAMLRCALHAKLVLAGRLGETARIPRRGLPEPRGAWRGPSMPAAPARPAAPPLRLAAASRTPRRDRAGT